ncbi:MAG: hypothetical protein ACREMB_25915 [Candidatus Rokuibacteriota bacterium]
MLLAAVVMVLIEAVLFWAPGIGPIVAGLVGGALAGSAGNAALAAILPAIVVGVLLFLAFAYWQLPIVGGFLGLGLTAYLIVTRVLLILSAVAGALLFGRGAAG